MYGNFAPGDEAVWTPEMSNGKAIHMYIYIYIYIYIHTYIHT